MRNTMLLDEPLLEELERYVHQFMDEHGEFPPVQKIQTHLDHWCERRRKMPEPVKQQAKAATA